MTIKPSAWRLLLLPILFLTLSSRTTGQSIQLVRHGTTDHRSSSSTSVVVTLNGVSSGDLLTCSLTYGNPGGTTMSVSDNVNGAWSVANAAHFNTVMSQTTAQFYLANSKAGTTTITGTPGSAGDYGAMDCQEWSGVDTSSPLDQTKQQDGTTANPSSGSVTTTAGGELILGVLENGYSPKAGSGFNLIDSDTSGTGSALAAEYQIQASAGPAAATWTLAATSWTAQIATFKAAHVQASIVLVRHGTTDHRSSSSTSVVVTLNGVSSGDLLTCSLTYGNPGGTTMSVSDNVNGAWSVANAAHFNTVMSQTTAQFYLANSKAGTTTITGTPGSAGDYGAMDCQEWSGVDTSSPLDQTKQQDGTTANPSSGSVTTTAGGELILGVLENGYSPKAGSGFNLIDSDTSGTGSALAAEYQIQASAGPAAATWTLAATSWTAQIATFKAAGGGAGGTSPRITSLSPTSGPVGTLVTVAGTNFGATQGTSTVTFNGKVGTPKSWSATSVTVPAPSGATTGNVVVTVGGVASGGINFTVTTGPVPVITSGATADGTARMAFTYQITATNSPTSFGALGLPNGLTVDTASGLISGSTDSAGIYTVTLNATNSIGTGTASLTLDIASGATGPVVSHTIRISNDADDGYYNSQNGSGWNSSPGSGGADLVGSWTGKTKAWVTGYRFPSVGAFSGDTIQTAYLRLWSSGSSATSLPCGAAPCNNSYIFRVYGVAEDNGSAFSGTTGNTPLDVPYTKAYTDYTSTGPGDAHGSCKGNNQGQNTCTHTIDVTNIVREITSRPGWTSTSAMRFVMLSTDANAPRVYAGYEDFSGNASKAATLIVNPAAPTIVSSGAWGTGAHPTYPTTYTVGPFVYPRATTLLLFLGDYYNFYTLPILEPSVSDSCGNHWRVLAGPTNWAGFFYDMRSTVFYVQNPATCPAGATITVKVNIEEPIFLHFLAVAGSNTGNAPIASAITSPNPTTYTTSATSDSITLTHPGLLVSWIFGDSDAMHIFTPKAGFITDLNSTPNYLTTASENVSVPETYQSQFSISPSDGWQIVIVGLQAP